MAARWIDKHMPVITRRINDAPNHVIYQMFSVGRPYGKEVLCHMRSCRHEVTYRADKRVKHTCKGCGSFCWTEKVTSDQTTLLGSRSIVKTVYPMEQYPAQWKNKDDPNLEPSQSKHKASNKRSRSLVSAPQTRVEPPAKPHAKRPSPPTEGTPFLRPPVMGTRSTSLPEPAPTPGPSSSSLRITVPARKTRSPSEVRGRDRLSATPTPPPTSSHEPSPAPSERSDRSGRKRLAPEGPGPSGGKSKKQKGRA